MNLARKKATDKGLAKRLKNLVKRWQKLLQSCTSNGLPAGTLSTDNSLSAPTPPLPATLSSSMPDGLLQISTPSSQPSLIMAPLQTQQSATPTMASSSSVQSTVTTYPTPSVSPAPSVSTTLSTPVGARNDAIFNRRQKLQMLSQLTKRPCASLVTASGAAHTSKYEAAEMEQDAGPTPSADAGPTSSADAGPTSSADKGTTSSADKVTTSSADKGTTSSADKGTTSADRRSDGESLVLTDPERLIVSIPHVAITKAFSKHPPTCTNGNASMTSSPPSPMDHTFVGSPTEQAISVVAPPSIDHTSHLTTPLIKHTLSLVVSIDTSRLRQNHVTVPVISTSRTTVSEETIKEPFENTSVPAGCVPGINGHIGQDGYWYDWTKAMPPIDGTSVTVLPYVYLDDWDVVDH